MELSGRRHYLGEFGSPESKERYARLLTEWQAGGGTAPLGKKERDALTVIELVSRFWTFHETYYRRPDGSLGRELANHRSALRALKDLYGETLVKDFGPLALEAIRERLIAQTICRKYVNRSIGRIKRVFRWGVAKELVSSSVYEALRCVEGLKRGRGGARETAPVKPVPPEHVEAVRPYVSAQVWALIQLQLLTGARSGELVVLRPCDLDRSGPV